MIEKILIVEDEEKMARMLELELQHEGYKVRKAFDGREALEIFESEHFDLILLDIMLPKLSGTEVLRRIRRNSHIPIIMITARDSIMDKVFGLDSGANDYITKPFVIEELLARIRACFRYKSSSASSKLLSAMGLTLNKDSNQVMVGNQEVELTHKEFELLQCLIENKGRVLTRDILLDKVWGYDYVGDTNAVDVYIRFLRSKIDEVFQMKLIHTVRGKGYMIKDEQSVENADESN